MSNKDGGPAFPYVQWERNVVGENVPICSWDGMTLRDWFAGMAIQGTFPGVGQEEMAAQYAKAAYAMADAMIAEREKSK